MSAQWEAERDAWLLDADSDYREMDERDARPVDHCDACGHETRHTTSFYPLPGDMGRQSTLF